MNYLILVISIIFLIIDLIIYQKNKQYFNRKIKNSNKMRFTKLSKQFLNNTDIEDIKDLICFLYKYIKEKKKKCKKK